MKKRIFVLYTGGTIGMSESERGLRPDTALVNQALTPFAEGMDFDWQVCTPLIDSSALRLQNWQDWLGQIRAALPKYDGVLVLHGTDTLAYTANFLALSLGKLTKPVVLTGSQWPYNSANSDAPKNLATAVAALDLADLQQVALAFNGKLFGAVGSSKVSTETADGFANWHFGELGRYEQGSWHDLRLSSAKYAEFATINPNVNVAAYTLIPGQMLATIAESLRNTQAKGVILQTFGHGNAPSDADFIDAVKSYTARGGILLNISQVAQGCAAKVYAEGDALRQAGSISGGKCNLETATSLLSLVLSADGRREDVQNVLENLGLLA
ncbi:MAG: asparaginase [Neisseria sp.]|nr:asparaginase [Neisseria sp.]